MSFIEYSADNHFPIQNLPYGVFSTDKDEATRAGVAIGDYILDLKALSSSKYFDKSPVPAKAFQGPNLDAFIATDPEDWAKFRTFLQDILSPKSPLKDEPRDKFFVSRTDKSTHLHLPMNIGDYSDFFASHTHAYNAGALLRGVENALQPNWRHLPVGYHARASSIVVSGTPFHRPVGQMLVEETDTQPTYRECRRLDYELEIGVVYGGKPTKFGQRLSPDEARKHTFGLVLLNDWSARDIQNWEIVPLGPFVSKNFATSISPWIVSPLALEPFKVPQQEHKPPLLPYLDDKNGFQYKVDLWADIKGEGETDYTNLCTTTMDNFYYTFAQMIVHQVSTGCIMRPGDLCGSGTVSAPTGEEGLACLIERNRLGAQPFKLNEKRQNYTWIEDGDSIRLTGVAKHPDGYSIGFGECEGTVLPPVPY